MLIQLIHLSDLHLTTNSFNIEKQLKKMIDSIIIREKLFEIEAIYICITGDLTDSNKIEAFSLFKKFIDSLKQKLFDKTKLNVEILFVPGNHDIKIVSDSKRNKNIHQFFNTRNIDLIEENLNVEIKNMENFFDLSAKYGLFSDNKLLSIKKFKIKDRKVDFFLLNTAPFSYLEKNDKDIHYISSNILESISSDCKTDLRILLMHHSKEWYSEICSEKIENLLNYCDICLYGHSHKNDMNVTNNNISFISGPFNIFGNNNSNFSIFLIDIDNIKVSKYIVKFDRTLNKFVRDSNSEEYCLINRNKRNYYNKKRSYYEDVTIEKQRFKLEDIFVMPIVTYISDEKTIEYKDEFNDFILFIEKHKYIKLQGYTGGGKSLLTKKICKLYIEREKYVILHDGSINITNNYNTTLKNLFYDNYDEKFLDDFLQSGLEDKILIIDYADVGSQKFREFINYSKQFFGIIIITSNLTFRTKKELFISYDDTEFKILNIELFSSSQREKLIRNIASIKGVIDDFDDIVKYFELLKATDTFVSLASPDTLSCLIVELIDCKWYLDRNTKSTYSIAFEHTINKKIEKNKGNINEDDILLILKEIAYKIYSLEKGCDNFISESNLIKLISSIKNIYGLTKSTSYYLEYLGRSELIETKFKLSENGYSFIKGNYFCYFLAEKMIWLESNDSDTWVNMICEIQNNILKGYNSDILLFFTYKTQKISFFENLMKNLEEKMGSVDPLSFDSRNNFILKKISYVDFYKSKVGETKSHFKNREQETERSRINYQENNIDSNIDYTTESDEINNFLVCIKFIEIISKGLGGFKGNLTFSRRNDMLNCIYVNLFKVFYLIFDFDENTYNGIKSYLLNSIKSNDNSTDEDKLETKLVNLFYSIMTTFILNILTNVSQIFISSASIENIKKFSVLSQNKISYDSFIFKLVALERYGNFELFYNFLKEHYSYIKAVDIQNIAIKIAMLFIITSKVNIDNTVSLANVLNVDKKMFLKLIGKDYHQIKRNK